MRVHDIPQAILGAFRRGMVIPALPLALDAARRFDARRERALIRYYNDAGAGGLAVGVHATQFEIRRPEVGLLEPVLRLASETLDAWESRRGRPLLKIAGACGRTEQALAEAVLARGLGYHAVLLSLSAYRDDSIEAMIRHCRRVAEVMPIVGFYLQPAVGGRVLPYEFWRAFAEIENALAVKIAPFHRYRTLDVVRAVCDAGRAGDIALYTGNDDTIVTDLLTPFPFRSPERSRAGTQTRAPGSGDQDTVHITGGLLGHWGVWTREAVRLLEEVRTLRERGGDIPQRLLTRAAETTDANGAFFDAANDFAGCIPGIHEVLRRQGLLEGTLCLDPDLGLSPGQAEEIDRVIAAYPHLSDDAFVAEHLEEWLRE